MLKKREILYEKFLKMLFGSIHKNTDYLIELAKDIDYLKKETHDNAVRLNALVHFVTEQEKSKEKKDDVRN